MGDRRGPIGVVYQIARKMGLFSPPQVPSVSRAIGIPLDMFVYRPETHRGMFLRHLPNPLTYSLSFWAFYDVSFRLRQQGHRLLKGRFLPPPNTVDGSPSFRSSFLP